MKLFCNTTLDATQSLVRAAGNNHLATVPTLIFGDVKPIEIVFLGEGGGLAPFTGQGGHEIKIAIGKLSTREILTQTNLDGDGKAVLNLATIKMASEINEVEQKTFTFEIQISYANGKTNTLCQMPCTIQNQLIKFYELPSAPQNVTIQNTSEPTTFLLSDVGRQILALQDKPARGLVLGEIYTITLVQSDLVHAQTTGGGVGIHFTHNGLQWEFLQEWLPSEIDTELWLDASDSSTITHNQNIVTQWNDKSGNNNNLIANAAPITNTTEQNNLNVIALDGNDYFEINNFTNPTSGNLQAYIVCNVTTVDNNADAIIAMDAASNDWQIGAGNNSQFRGILTFANQPNGSTTVASNAGLIGFNIFCADLDFSDDGKYRLLVNGEQLQGTIAQNYTSKLASNVDLKIFTNRAENNYPEGEIAEIIIVDSTSDTVRQKIEGYLAHKWGLEENLPTGHQYKNSAP